MLETLGHMILSCCFDGRKHVTYQLIRLTSRMCTYKVYVWVFAPCWRIKWKTLSIFWYSPSSVESWVFLYEISNSRFNSNNKMQKAYHMFSLQRLLMKPFLHQNRLQHVSSSALELHCSFLTIDGQITISIRLYCTGSTVRDS